MTAPPAVVRAATRLWWPGRCWPSRYLYLQFKDFKEGRRDDAQMIPFAMALSREDLFDPAAFFSAQTLRNPNFKVDPEKAACGEMNAVETLCAQCHRGGFQAGRRTNDAGNMASVSKTLSEEGIDDFGHDLVGLQ